MMTTARRCVLQCGSKGNNNSKGSKRNFNSSKCRNTRSSNRGGKILLLQHQELSLLPIRTAVAVAA